MATDLPISNMIQMDPLRIFFEVSNMFGVLDLLQILQKPGSWGLAHRGVLSNLKHGPPQAKKYGFCNRMVRCGCILKNAVKKPGLRPLRARVSWRNFRPLPKSGNFLSYSWTVYNCPRPDPEVSGAANRRKINNSWATDAHKEQQPNHSI